MWIFPLLIILFLGALYVTRFSIILFNVNTSRGNVLLSSRRRKVPIKTMVVVGSGGHTTEILRLVESLSHHYSPRFYVLADTDKMSEEKIHALEGSRKNSAPQNKKISASSYELLRIPRSREVLQSWVSTVFTTLRASLRAFPLVFQIRPDLVLCNGPGTCIPVCVAAFLLTVIGFKKTSIVYVESFCRVETLSMSGRILYHFADQFVVQWEPLNQKYPRSTFLGRVV